MTDASDAGSVLVDALVGLGVLAITLTLASEAVQSGLRRSQRSEDVRMAQLVARSELAAVGVDIPLATGRTSGRNGPLAWIVEVAPQAQAFRVSVEVTAPDGARLAALQALRAGE